MKKLLAIILAFALAIPFLSACAKTSETASSSSGSPGPVNTLTADEYFATPREFEYDNTRRETFYYYEDPDEPGPVFLEPSAYRIAVDGDKLEVIDGDKTRVIYEGDFKHCLNADDDYKNFYKNIKLVGDILVFSAAVEDGYEIRYAYIYDGESRLAAKSADRPYGFCAVSNHEFIWYIYNEEYDRIYLEKKENHPKEQDYIFEPDFEILYRGDFERIYNIYPTKYYYIDVVSGYTFSVDSGSGSEMELFDPLYSRWWTEYLPNEDAEG